MLISPRELKWIWKVRPTFVVHVGAHLAEEYSEYISEGWGSRGGVLWIEADEERASHCLAKVGGTPGHAVVSAVLSDVDGDEVTWYAADNGQSSSFLRPAQHLNEYPQIKFTDDSKKVTTRFDSLAVVFPDRSRVLVNLDIQGAEMRALKGFGAQLNEVDWVYCEVNAVDLYEGVPKLGELDKFLGEANFKRVDLAMTQHGWGDALYCRESCLPRAVGVRRFARRLVGHVGAVTAVLRAVARRVRSLPNRRD